MRDCNDKIAQTVDVLSGKVRHLDVRIEQTLSYDGETAQSRTGRCRYGMC